MTGFAVVLASIYFFIHESWAVAFALLVIGSLMWIGKSGIEIRKQPKSIRTYHSIAGVNIGRWTLIRQFDKVEITRTKNSRTVTSKWVEHTTRNNHYNVIFSTEDGGAEYKILELDSHPSARKFARRLCIELEFKLKDNIKLAQQQSLKKRASGNKRYGKGRGR